MNYIGNCLEKFRELPVNVREILGGIDACLAIEKIETEYEIKLGFMVILVGIGELSMDDIPKYLEKKYNISEDDSIDIQNELTREIFSNLLLIKTEDPIISEDRIKEYFKSSILKLLKDGPLAKEVNKTIFATFVFDETFQDELLKIFLFNEETIGNSRIFLSGRDVIPTIGNWIRDFIVKYGSDTFSDVALAEYLSSSQNVKNLKSEEKESLRKVLRVYYNLSFFPDSVDNLTPDNWQIIPVDKLASDEIFDVLSDEKPKPSATPIPQNVNPQIITQTEILEEAAVPELTERQKTIFDLQKTLTKYSPSSLEYKAIHQEINRLSHK